MESRDHRILLASLVELRECYHGLVVSMQDNAASFMHELMLERLGRLERGEFYSESSDSGIAEDSDGGS
jgi:hypothetical protein